MPLDTSTYSLALLRLDGRRWNELRRIHAQISTQAAADGSSYLEMGNTKILVSVTGPAEGKQSGPRGGADKQAKIDVEINFAGFSGVERRKRKSDKRTTEMEHCLRSAFEGVLLLHLYPHSTITLNIHIISQDGSLLAACINASTLALIDAGIPMTDYLVACTAASSASASAADNASADDPLLDLNNQEELELPFLTVGTLGESDSVAVCIMESRVRMERLEGMLAIPTDDISKLITIFGATGNQGGSAVKHILASPTLPQEFKIRGITRDASKPAAQDLANKGVEMVSADMSSKGVLEAALEGSHTVFLLTDTWDSTNTTSELIQGKNVVDVAKKLGVQHLSFSSLLHVTKTTNGHLSNVPHFDAKADIEQYIRDSGVPGTFFLPGYFMSNIPMSVQKGEDGSLNWALPVSETAKFPLFDVKEDTGKFITVILRNRDALLGARILGATAYYTPKQIVATLSTVTGKSAHFLQVPDEVYKSFLPGYMAQEMLENHLFIEEPGYYNGADLFKNHEVLGETGELGLTSWEAFVRENMGAF
ncbi:NAD(P)-binding protein [Clathrospora elynae]|uniref:Ribosomal RNA-processing protein 41 n=1 Tax=Clathrospora elynae TaxID=706981 RepID=A0A6A5S5X3_9PLEO|nr:NAD(P)-binding protein [Clathrospora elynae]